MTNFANIKSMNIKQMAKFLATLNGGGIVREEWFLNWLKEKKGGEVISFDNDECNYNPEKAKDYFERRAK